MAGGKWEVGGGVTFHEILGLGGHRGGQWEPRQQGLGQSSPILRAGTGRSEEVLPSILRLPGLLPREVLRVLTSLGQI